MYQMYRCISHHTKSKLGGILAQTEEKCSLQFYFSRCPCSFDIIVKVRKLAVPGQ